MSPQLQPLPPVLPPPPPPEPPDGSLIRFNLGRYNYVAVRRGSRWETTASGDWRGVTETMTWDELATPARKFEYAARFTAIDPRDDPRVRDHLAVVRFIVAGQYLAAINIADDLSYEGYWYTTATEQVARSLPIACRIWSEISRFGRPIEMATDWEPVE